MPRKPRIGLLPLYLKLYDEARPEVRDGFTDFLGTVRDGFETRGVEVEQAAIARATSEVEVAMETFTQAGVDLVVTLHLAYSPSLEAVDPLSTMGLPILLLDTTMDYAFGPDVPGERLMYNHGIHGVQDLASMLRRRGKPFEIVAGHVTESPVLDRAADIARAAYAARLLREMRVLRIGDSFSGMGDFAVEEHILRDRLGIAVNQVGVDALAKMLPKVSEAEVDEEMARDRERFQVEVSEGAHRASVRAGLALRRLLEREGYGAFSMNFLAFDGHGGIETVPFLEASKAMARGIGYAGEGDVLTAALAGAVASAFGDATFTEVFCPDWKGGSLFLSHMGEINPDIAASKPVLCEKDFPWTEARNPVIAACSPAPGPAAFLNAAPGPDDAFGLIITPMDVLDVPETDSFREMVRGWVVPAMPLDMFLEEYSRLGGTHHSVLALGDRPDMAEAFSAFARFAGLGVHTL